MPDTIIDIPGNLKKRLIKNSSIESRTNLTIEPFVEILEQNKLYFFPEYTDHGIKHIENVLHCIEKLIHKNTFNKLDSLDISVMKQSVVLHDIGMHVNIDMFTNMISGKYDNYMVKEFDTKTWSELWEEYLTESKFWSHQKREMIFGDAESPIKRPNLENPKTLDEYDKFLIGEFIRRNHPRLAHEIALYGYHGSDLIRFGKLSGKEDSAFFTKEIRNIVGLVARSHGIHLREAIGYLKDNFAQTWKKPEGINAIYLMVLLRLSDYLQLKDRTSPITLKLKTFNSPYSINEHKMHLAIKSVRLGAEQNEILDDKELIYVETTLLKNAPMYVKLENLISDIQQELDTSWAVLGEIYGRVQPLDINYRRIGIDITDTKKRESYPFVPEKVTYQFNKELSKLLIEPLYGNEPSYGVRELIQNAIDACIERSASEEGKKYTPEITVHYNPEASLFTIEDNGKGMTLYEIKNYFLTIGSSFIKNSKWKQLADENKSIYRSGRFGIGVLAAYLIGDKIKVTTKSVGDLYAYQFETRLDDDFIEIKKTEKIEIGTTIEIKTDKEIKTRLENGDEYYYYPVLWHDWYIYDFPAIKYFYNNQQFIPKSSLRSYVSDFVKLKHNSNNYGEVFWFPDIYLFYISLEKYLICNGIIITGESEKALFKNKSGEHFLYNIDYFPGVSIYDIHNNIPLTLNRNNLEGNFRFDFEPELQLEVTKRSLFLLLNTFEINLFDRKIHKLFDINIISTKIIYLKDGFFPNTTFFWNKFNQIHPEFKSLYIIYLQKRNKNDIKRELISEIFPQLIDKYKDGCFLFVYDDYDFDLAALNVEIEWAKGNFKKYERYNILPDIPENKYNYIKKEPYETNSLVDIFSPIGEYDFFIAKCSAPNTNLKLTGDINDLFERSFPEDIVIPYYTDKRRKKFSLVIEELKDYRFNDKE